MMARVKYKVVPRFSSWVEILDPCHRSMWRALEFDSGINQFGKYDLRAPIPCPDTRAKPAVDRNYAKRRSGPKDIGKDLRINNTPSHRPFPVPRGEGGSAR